MKRPWSTARSKYAEHNKTAAFNLVKDRATQQTTAVQQQDSSRSGSSGGGGGGSATLEAVAVVSIVYLVCMSVTKNSKHTVLSVCLSPFGLYRFSKIQLLLCLSFFFGYRLKILFPLLPFVLPRPSCYSKRQRSCIRCCIFLSL